MRPRGQGEFYQREPYRWGFVDYALSSIPLAGLVLALVGRLAGWA